MPPPGFSSPAEPPEPAAVRAPSPAPEGPADRRWKMAAGAGAIIAAAVAAFLALGSGGSGLSGPVAQAATVSSNTAGYRMHMSVEIASSASSTPITGTGNAIVDLRDHATSMSLALNFGDSSLFAQALGGGTMRLRMIMAGDTIYMKLPAVAASVLPSGGKAWVKLSLSKLAGIPGLSSLTSNPTTTDPSQMLQFLRSGSDVVLNEGRAMVDGFETTHYQSEVSLSQLAGRLGGLAQQAVSKLQQLAPSGDIPIDVWIDSAHLVRRMAVTLALGGAAGPSVRETVTADLSDYGLQPAPVPPPSSDVQDLSSLASGG